MVVVGTLEAHLLGLPVPAPRTCSQPFMGPHPTGNLGWAPGAGPFRQGVGRGGEGDNAPLQGRDVPVRPGGPGQRLVLQEAFTVQQLPHGQVRQLLHELEGLADVEEHGEEELLVPGVHTDALREEQGGILLQPRDVHPSHHQAHWTPMGQTHPWVKWATGQG